MTTILEHAVTDLNSAMLYKGGLYEYWQDSAEDGIKLRIEDYDDKAVAWRNIFFQHLPTKEMLPKVDGGVRALELGCNTGYNVKEYEKIYGYAEGVDSNARLIEASKLNHPNCKRMYCENLQYPDGSFSVVFAKDVYEHCYSPMDAIAETYRVLADGGYVLAMIPLDGENIGVDDIAVHDVFNYGNYSHTWKATAQGAIMRFFRAGFTDIETQGYQHSELFGEHRDLGDFVLVLRARKVEGIRRVPEQWLWGNPYWAAFLTFVCTGNCGYCIQHMSKEEFLKARVAYNRNMLLPQDWIEFYNGLQKWKNQKLGLIGGEPTVYPGFFDVLNGLKGYYRTMTTNLTTHAFTNIVEFVGRIEDKENLRINTSFHPGITGVDEFTGKIHQLRDAGMYVDQISIVAHPGCDYKKYINEFLARGIHLTPQTYLGGWDGRLFPDQDSDYAPDFGEHEIDNQAVYREGFSCQQRNNVLCNTNRFMVAPNGDIHKCHYLMYSGKNALGNIKDYELPAFNDYDVCPEYGFCNPCDFPHANFKNIQLNIKAELEKVLTDPQLSDALWDWFTEHTTPEFRQVMSEIVGILYCSKDPYWTLYNDPRIPELINEYLSDEELYDNSKERLFAQMDGSLFRFARAGVNVYRLLDEIPMLKYIDALGHVVRTVITEHHPSRVEVFTKPELAIALDTYISNIMATVGTSYLNDGTISIWRKLEDVKEEEE